MINLVSLAQRVFHAVASNRHFRPEFLLKNGCTWRSSGRQQSRCERQLHPRWRQLPMRREAATALRSEWMPGAAQPHPSWELSRELSREHPCKEISVKQPRLLERALLPLYAVIQVRNFSLLLGQTQSHSVGSTNTGQKNPCWGPIWEGLAIFSEGLFKVGEILIFFSKFKLSSRLFYYFKT